MCYEKIFLKLKSDQIKHCQKSCNVKEFITQLDLEKWGNNLYPRPNFKYCLELAESNRDVRTLQPFKTVKTEYWIVTFMSLMGVVGGTMGMFVGFSIMRSTFEIKRVILRYWLERK